MDEAVTRQKPGNDGKLFRTMDKKAAVSDAEKLKKETQKKTAKLRELRLAKEAEDRTAQGTKTKAKKKSVKRKKLPAFERDT